MATLTTAAALLALLAPNAAPPPAGADHPELSPLPLNQIQVIGTHNSYKKLIQPELFEGMLARNPGVTGLDYGHLPIPEQLDMGLRNLELDLYNDPAGGHYARPLGNTLLSAMGGTPEPFNTEGELDSPGFKVMHDCNFDFRSHTLRLEDTLAGMRYWSAMNPGHLPVFVTLNLKSGDAPMPGAIDPVEWDTAALERFDDALLAHLGRENLVLPDDLRGEAASLREAIDRDGWPAVGECRGRFFFIIDHGGRLPEIYREAHPALAGAAMFTVNPPDAPDTVFRVINEPHESTDSIAEAIGRGQIVRTRADANTAEMRAGDLSRFEAAKTSGAQIITTDYPVPDTRHHPTYRVVFEGGTFARVNPVTGH